MQHAAQNVTDAITICNVQRPRTTCTSIQLATCNIRRATCTMQRAACSIVCHATCNMRKQHATCRMQMQHYTAAYYETRSAQCEGYKTKQLPATCRMQHATRIIQHMQQYKVSCNGVTEGGTRLEQLAGVCECAAIRRRGRCSTCRAHRAA